MDQKNIDLKNLLKHFADDQEILLEVMSRYLALYPQFMQNINQALEQKNSKGLVAAAHSLKGSVSHFFVVDIFSELSEIEACANKDDFELANVKLSQLLPKLDSLNKELVLYVEGTFDAKAD